MTDQTADAAIKQRIEARGVFRINAWDGTEFDKLAQFETKTPTARKVLEKLEFIPADEHILLHVQEAGGIVEVPLDSEIQLDRNEATTVAGFRADRIFKLLLNERRLSWGEKEISIAALRTVTKTADDQQFVLELKDEADRPLEETDLVALDDPGLERIYTRARSWKLLVQGVLLTFDTPQITVRDALVKAGLDPDQGWTAVLKFVGAPKESVQLNDTIDLSRKGIEKLWLRPDHVNNGEAHAPVNRAFVLRAEDEDYLAKRTESTETIIDGGKRWFILRGYKLPDGYRQEAVDIAVLMPPSYPAAQLDMFFCAPHLSLESGHPIPQTQSRQTIAGRSYQRWSRHRSGPTVWNPAKDSLISHIALIEDAIAREVGAN